MREAGEPFRGEDLIPSKPPTEWWRPAESGGGEKRNATEGIVVPSDRSGPFIALLVFTFVLVISPQSIFPALQSLRPAWLAATASIAMLLLDRLPRGGPFLIACRETKAAFCLAVWAVVTVPFSYW